MRQIICVDPLIQQDRYAFEQSAWPAKWIGHPRHGGAEAVVLGFRRRFHVERDCTLRLHVSADERYELFLDGQRIGSGSERGDLSNWFYETYDQPFEAGDHVLVARVWWLGNHGPAPVAQVGVSPAFLLMAERAQELLSTGVAEWDALKIEGYSFTPARTTGYTAVGARSNIDGRLYPWGVEAGRIAERPYADQWTPAAIVGAARIKALAWEADTRLLRPALLPAMNQTFRQAGQARHVMEMASFELPEGKENGPPILAAENLAAERHQWNAMLAGQGPVTIAPHTRRRVLVDLDDYHCAYGDLVTSGGRDAMIRTLWAESLYHRDPKPGGEDGDTYLHKGNRDEIEGKSFIGMGATFMLDGGRGGDRHYSPLWWDAGRYVAIDVQTFDEALTVERFTLRETGYPFAFVGEFDASDSRLARVTQLALRTLRACAHETYMDCPYYEQLMYVGDTRVEVLTTYTISDDDRLPRKAVELFDLSRDHEGFTASRYPARMRQRIPPFSMWWVGMVHDAAHWRDDADFIRARMAGVRAVCEAVRGHLDKACGLVMTPPGWNFVDWVPTWPAGVPPVGARGFKATINLQAALMFRQAGELEHIVGEALMAQRNRDTADALFQAIDASFWDESRGLYSDDLEHAHFSEHAQCLALIEGSIQGERRRRLGEGLLSQEMARATLYFMHYLFEAYRLLGQTDQLIKRMDVWFGLADRGFRTTPEVYEPRSDCHAWGAHPVFHYFASILGIRPGSAGFKTVHVQPQLGSLQWAKGKMPHPRGMIAIEARQRRRMDRVARGRQRHIDNESVHATTPAGNESLVMIMPAQSSRTGRV